MGKSNRPEGESKRRDHKKRLASNRKLLTPPSIAFLIEVDAFHDTITLAIRVLISGLEGKYESAVKAMLTLNWAACEGVGEESAYVRVRREGGTERERKGGK